MFHHFQYGSVVLILLIKFSLNCKIAWSTKPPVWSNFVLCLLCFEHPQLLYLAGFCYILLENLMTILFHLWTDKTKAAHYEQIFLGRKVSLARDIEGFVLLCDISLSFLKSLILGGLGHSSCLFSIRLSSNLWGWYLQILFNSFSSM